MQLYRLCRQRYAELSGFGAKKTGGRWNRKGIAALYTAENASLAVLEVLVHLDKDELPEDYVMLEIAVHDDAIASIGNSESEQLSALYEKGHRALSSRLVGFSIPSAVVSIDRIVVLYPEAESSREAVTTTQVTPFAFDRRLFLPSKP